MALSLPRALRRTLALAALLTAGPLSAADLALVLANWDYRHLEDTLDARELRGIADRLEEVGFEVIDEYNADAEELRAAAASFGARAEEADRVLIVLDGHVVSTGTDAWLLGRDARDPGPLSLSAQGVSLTALAEIAGAAAAGRAVILAGRSGTLSPQDTGLRSGTQGMTLPQGVTLASGTPDWLRHAIFAGLLREGVSLGAALSQLSARGFLSRTVGFTEGGITPSRPPVDTDAIRARGADDGFWEAARSLGSEEALQLYLDRHPDGDHVEAARQQLAALDDARANRWQRAETELGLGREDRRQVQRDLTLLGYNTRGIDGIFGRGTRSALETWQRDQRLEVTGYLDRRQWRLLGDAAEDRRADQAEAARREEERVWQETEGSGSEADLRAYLERYPEGRHVAEARRRLERIEERRATETRREARQAWRDAQEQDTLAGYEQFLARYGQSEFAEAARRRVEEIRQEDAGRVTEAARSEEQEILRSSVTRLLVEQRLASLGYRPGAADGQFTEQTRAAIRTYQEDRGIYASGFVTKRTAAFLLAGR